MGCPLCKEQKSVATSTLDYFIRKTSGSLRTSRLPARLDNGQEAGGQTGTQNCKLPPGEEEEPPLYILSGQPAVAHPTPPKKAPRTSGWKNVQLTAAEAPSRPPRRHNKTTQTPLSMSPANTLKPPQESITKSESSNSLSQSLGIPEETVQRLEEYLKKNQSFSSLQMLMNQLQASSHTASLSSSSDDEDLNPGCAAPGEEEEIAKVNVSPPVVPIRKRRSIENKSDINLPPSTPPPPPPVIDESSQDSDVSSEHNSFVLRGHWEDQNDTQSIVHTHHNNDLNTTKNKKILPPRSPILNTPTSPSRLSPFIGRLTSVDENNSRPGTPGPWFDRGGGLELPSSPSLKRFSPTKSLLLVNHSSNNLRAEVQHQVTPPPSENEADTDEEVPQEITHSVLLKILQQCSDEFGSDDLVTRRASILPNNISFEGLHEFIDNFQKVEQKDHDSGTSTPSIGDLRSALADLLENEKIIEKEQRISSSLSPSSSSLSLQKAIDK